MRAASARIAPRRPGLHAATSPDNAFAVPLCRSRPSNAVPLLPFPTAPGRSRPGSGHARGRTRAIAASSPVALPRALSLPDRANVVVQVTTRATRRAMRRSAPGTAESGGRARTRRRARRFVGRAPKSSCRPGSPRRSPAPADTPATLCPRRRKTRVYSGRPGGGAESRPSVPRVESGLGRGIPTWPVQVPRVAGSGRPRTADCGLRTSTPRGASVAGWKRPGRCVSAVRNPQSDPTRYPPNGAIPHPARG
jgi:hypothetical protein